METGSHSPRGGGWAGRWRTSASLKPLTLSPAASPRLPSRIAVTADGLERSGAPLADKLRRQEANSHRKPAKRLSMRHEEGVALHVARCTRFEAPLAIFIYSILEMYVQACVLHRSSTRPQPQDRRPVCHAGIKLHRTPCAAPPDHRHTAEAAPWLGVLGCLALGHRSVDAMGPRAT